MFTVAAMQFWILLFVLHIYPKIIQADEELCLTPHCLRSADMLFMSLDSDVNPCDDFYKYTCGNFKKNYVPWPDYDEHSFFIQLSKKIDNGNQAFLEKEDSKDEPPIVHKARDIYRSCVDLLSDEQGFQTLKKVLRATGMSSMPAVRPKKLKISLMKILTNTYKLTGQTVFIGVTVSIDPLNSTQFKMELDSEDETNIGEKSFRRDSLRSLKVKKTQEETAEEEEEEEEEETLEHFALELSKLLNEFFNHDGINTNDLEDYILQAANDLYHIIEDMDMIKADESVMFSPKVSPLPMQMTLNELQDILDEAARDTPAKKKRSKIKLETYFKSLFHGFENINFNEYGNETILVRNLPYLKKLSKMFTKYTERQLSLYVWFRIFEKFSFHASTELNEEYIKMRNRVYSINTFTGRESQCAYEVYSTMYRAVDYRYLTDPSLVEKIKHLNVMINLMREEWHSILEKADWMGNETKARAIEKSNAMQFIIGLEPPYMEKESYQNLMENITNTNNNVLNFIQLYKTEVINKLNSLRTPNINADLSLPGGETTTYYIPEKNLIVIPAAMLDFPIFDRGLQVLDYATLGVFVAHEITHGFDSMGRFYDKNGNYVKWWEKEADAEYEKKADCFVRKYDNHLVPELNKTINGKLTLGETIADNGGLLIAANAYKKLVEKHGREKFLPGFQNYTHEQLFFLGYTNIWCTSYTDIENVGLLTDEHPPPFLRSVMTIKDFEEFSKTWNCPEHSPMRSSEKCALWIN